jgi:hypothetical protein
MKTKPITIAEIKTMLKGMGHACRLAAASRELYLDNEERNGQRRLNMADLGMAFPAAYTPTAYQKRIMARFKALRKAGAA